MTKKANPKVIGAFMVGAVVLAAIGVIIFGSGKFFAEKHIWVLYFPGSVKGLTVGAPVTLQGVEIGAVIDVKAVFDRETFTFRSPVYVEVFPDRVKSKGKFAKKSEEIIETDPEEAIKLLIERGLRARLELQSLVTGMLQVALDMYPGTPVQFVGLDKKVPEIPTIPAPMEQLAKALENLPLKEMVDDARKTLAAVEKLATSPELTEAVTALNNTLQDFGKLARNLDARIGPLADSATRALDDADKLVVNVEGRVEPLIANLNQTLDQARAALKRAEVALASVDDVVAEDSPLMWELRITLKELKAMAGSINALADDLQRQPDSIIRGKSRLGR